MGLIIIAKSEARLSTNTNTAHKHSTQTHTTHTNTHIFKRASKKRMIYFMVQSIESGGRSLLLWYNFEFISST